MPGWQAGPVPDTTTAVTVPEAGKEPGVGPGRRTTVLRVLGVAAMIGIALFWFWILSGAPRRQNPDYLSDRGWAARAETACAATMDRVDARAKTAGRDDRRARADAIDASTDDLREMLETLRAPLPSGASDRAVVEPWLDDWTSVLGDRSRYAEAVRRDPDAQYKTTPKFNDPLDQVVEVFAEANEMPSCAPAGDVG